MREIYYAKSPQKNGHQTTNKEHLEKVSDLAGAFAESFGCGQQAKLAGLFHDIGKYSESFQKVLDGTACYIDHAICGAVLLYGIKQDKLAYRAIIEAINGHHAGLLELGMLKDILEDIMRSDAKHIGNEGHTAALNGKAEYQQANQLFRRDFPDFSFSKLAAFLPPDASMVSDMLYTRMLFSCLVDADYSVSASDENPDYLEMTEQYHLEPETQLQRLYQYRDTIRLGSHAEKTVNGIRDELFDACGEKGKLPEGLFTLTAPTGTGKTLALLHFALQHAAEHHKKRIIVVLPYLTLADQTVDTYRKILPDVLVDHSQSNLSDEEREFAHRWSSPVIITTTVKFFESLFAYKPTDCRKLHHIADSIVLFDEAQSLPPEVTGCTLQTVEELCSRYHCTMVFSTATQPDFKQISAEWKPVEIMPEYAKMYQALRRVQVDWRIAEPTALEQIAEEMAGQTSVCTIVNLRAHARKLYQALKESCPEDSIFFLTTDLCAAHRKEIVAEINRRLDPAVHLPCRVIATQCIEAGVDLDFDVLYRALAPLEAIIQAAGRCNRNGRLQQGGKVVVFIPDEEKLYPSDWYGNAAEVVKEMAEDGAIDICDPDRITEYYRQLFIHHKDSEALKREISKRSFVGTAQQYKLISNRGMHVIVPFAGERKLYDRIVQQIRTEGLTRQLIKEAASITVTTFEKDIDTYAELLRYAVRGRQSKTESDYCILRTQYEKFYTNKMGLQFEEKENVKDPMMF